MSACLAVGLPARFKRDCQLTPLFVKDASPAFQDAFGLVAKLPAALPKIFAPLACPDPKRFPHFFPRLRSEKQRNRRADPEPKTKERTI